MKRRGFSLIELLVLVGVIALIAAILFPVFSRHRGSRRYSCFNNLKQLGVGFAQYMQDFNERMPLIISSSIYKPDDPSTPRREFSSYGWADALHPYAFSIRLYHCPDYSHPNEIPKTFAPLKRDCTDYWLNGRVAGLYIADVKAPAQTLMLGDGNDGGDMTDARYNYSALPAPWLNDENSPPFRHIGSAVYCFMDGHVKAAKPDEISKASLAKGKWHFTPK